MAGFLDTPVAGPLTLRKVGQGLREAIGAPMASDIQQGNVAIKQAREEYPTVDNLAGIHPLVAAGQVANDMAVGQTDGGTAMNVAQAIPVVKGLRGLSALLSKAAGPKIYGTKYVVDAPATIKKNIALTGAQVLGQPAHAE